MACGATALYQASNLVGPTMLWEEHGGLTKDWSNWNWWNSKEVPLQTDPDLRDAPRLSSGPRYIKDRLTFLSGWWVCFSCGELAQYGISWWIKGKIFRKPQPWPKSRGVLQMFPSTNAGMIGTVTTWLLFGSGMFWSSFGQEWMRFLRNQWIGFPQKLFRRPIRGVCLRGFHLAKNKVR